jgi:hypothetical protein
MPEKITKNICYLNFCSISSFFFPTLLDDAIINSKDLKHNVLFVYCDGELPACDANPTHSKMICTECIYLTKSKLKKDYCQELKIAKLSSFITSEVGEQIASLQFNFQSLEDIKKISYKGMNIGLGTVSSFVSKTRNLNPVFDKDVNLMFINLLKGACFVTEAVEKIITKSVFDRIKFCNGRLTSERAVYESALKLKIDFNVLELTSSSKAFNFKKIEFYNSQVHSIEANTDKIEEYWISNSENRINADNFYIKRRLGEYASDKVYVKNQQKGLLPINWDSRKRNFVIFNSSEDEFYSIGGTWNKFKVFENQYKGIKYIIESTKSNSSIHYFLRIHPNLKDVKYKYVTDLLNGFSNYNNITIIPPDSPISTYDLIDNSEKCIVFGSSVGVEATYWNKPVILLNGSLYFYLNVAYYPKNMNDLKELLYAKLDPKPKLGSLKYAHYIFGGRGVEFKYINPNSNVIKILNRQILLHNYLSIGNMIIRVLFRVLRVKDRKKIIDLNRKLYIEKT